MKAIIFAILLFAAFTFAIRVDEDEIQIQRNNCASSPKCLITPRCGPEEEPFFDKDENGCNIDCGRCVPKHRPCPAVRCSRYCPYGYKVDSRGCQTCECKCSSITCKIYCKYGHEIDPETKCPLCKCKTRRHHHWYHY